MATKPKAAKKAAKKADASTRKGGILDMKVKVTGDNPHRDGTVAFKMFKKYKAGKTVAENFKAGVTRPYLNLHRKMEVIALV